MSVREGALFWSKSVINVNDHCRPSQNINTNFTPVGLMKMLTNMCFFSLLFYAKLIGRVSDEVSERTVAFGVQFTCMPLMEVV